MSSAAYLRTTASSDIAEGVHDFEEAHPLDGAEAIISALTGWHAAERIRSWFKLTMLMAVLGFLVFITVDIHKNHELIEALTLQLATIDSEIQVVPCGDPPTIGCLVYNIAVNMSLV